MKIHLFSYLPIVVTLVTLAISSDYNSKQEIDKRILAIFNIPNSTSKGTNDFRQETLNGPKEEENRKIKFDSFNEQQNPLVNETISNDKQQNLDDRIFSIFHIPEDHQSSVNTFEKEENQKPLDTYSPIKQEKPVNENITDDIQEFSANLYEAVLNSQSNNVLISPLSANLALSMIAIGAEGSTKKEMIQTLCLPADDQLIQSSYKNLINDLMNVQFAELKILNKVFINNNLHVKETFKNISHNFYSKEEQLNFVDSETAAKTINTWVSEETNYKITNIVTSDALSKDTSMFIANVVYFKGEWKYKFSEVSNAIFTDIRNKKTLVPMMHQKREFEFGYVPNMKATFIELPYKNEELIMLIVLPDKFDGLKQIEKSLSTMSLKTLRQNRMTTSVDLYLPKFRVESTIDLNSILKKMGMKEMFTDSANFSAISEGNLKVSNVKQKTFIEVNEKGAEAAAITAMEMSMRFGGDSDPVTFNVNHPFHYKIIKTIDIDDGVILFTGNYKIINSSSGRTKLKRKRGKQIYTYNSF